MGRKVKAIPFKQERDHQIAAREAVQNYPIPGIPQNPTLLQLIVESLLIRLGSFDREMAQAVRNIIYELAVSEKSRELQADFYENFPILEEHAKLENMLQLGTLAVYKKGRKTHVDLTIKAQRVYLKDYFDEHGFPGNARNILTQKEWLKKHEPNILKLLGLLKCGCNYADSLDELRNNKKNVKSPKTEAQWLNGILATFHHTTTENIKKIHKAAIQTEKDIENLFEKQYAFMDLLRNKSPQNQKARDKILAQFGIHQP